MVGNESENDSLPELARSECFLKGISRLSYAALGLERIRAGEG